MQPTPAPTPQAQPAPSMMPQSSGGGGNKMVLWLIVGVVVVILIVGGIYFFMSSQQKSPSQTAQGTAIPTKQENLENDLNAVNVSDVDSDFSSVDQDLKNL